MIVTEMTFDGRVTTRLDSDTAAWLAGRSERMHAGSPHVQARTELGLWRQMLAVELRRVRLTLGEASCLADVVAGSALDSTLVGSGPGIMHVEAYDAFDFAPGEYGAKWDIDEQSLLGRLAGLGPVADHALRDALNRWWATKQEPTVAGFAAVGLRVSDRQGQGG